MRSLLLIIPVIILSSPGFCQSVQPVSKIITKEKFAEVDGHKMHYQIAGTGKPTVVFECGVTDNLNSWNPVFSEVSRFTTAVSYDRMGLGASDTATVPRSFKQIATDLHSMLHNAQISPPYILVGHSMGGPMIRAFAHLYKNEIAGMVFVDCMTEYDINGLPKDTLDVGLPPEIFSRRATPQESELYLLRREVLDSFPEMRSFDPLPDVPVHVFVGQKNIYELVANNRIEWYRKSISDQTESSLTVLPNARHYIHRDYPGLIVEAIRHMMFPNADRQLSKTLQQKGIDSCIAQYKKMKVFYPAGSITEGTLNTLGYYLMSKNDFQGAIKLFSLNVAMYPNSFNTYDSLADAFENAGNTKEAIANYKRSLQLNAENKNAVARLNKLNAMK